MTLETGKTGTFRRHMTTPPSPPSLLNLPPFPLLPPSFLTPNPATAQPPQSTSLPSVTQLPYSPSVSPCDGPASSISDPSLSYHAAFLTFLPPLPVTAQPPQSSSLPSVTAQLPYSPSSSPSRPSLLNLHPFPVLPPSFLTPPPVTA